MSTVELEMKKTRLARKILDEKDENVIVIMEENLRKIKHFTTNIRERKKLANDFFRFVETNSITEPNFKFNREECYDREMFL